MQTVTREIVLDIKEKSFPVSSDIVFTSADSGAYYLHVFVKKARENIDLSVFSNPRIAFRKLNGNFVQGEMTLSEDGRYFIYMLGTNEISFPGPLEIWAVLYDNGNRISSQSIMARVAANPLPDSAVESSSQFDALTRAEGVLADLEQALADFPDIKLLGTFDTYYDLVAAYPDGSGLGGGFVVISTGEFYIWSVVENAWTSVGSIQGPQGIQGIQGIQGEKGDKGDKGDQGIQGLQGIQGIQGLTGEQGIQGEKGDKGDTGAQGIKGEQGIPGPVNALQIGSNIYPPDASGKIVISDEQARIEMLTHTIYDLTVATTSTGPVAQIKGAIGGLPLEVTARVVATQEGTGDPSPENVRMISGKNSLSMVRSGKNLANIFNIVHKTPPTAYAALGSSLTLTASGAATYHYAAIPVPVDHSLLLGKQVTLSASWLSATSASQRITIGWVTTPTFTAITPVASLTTSGGSASFVIPSMPTGAYGLFIYLYHTAGTSVAAGTYTTFSNLQLELGSTATPYEPYVSDIYPIALPETVYGLEDAPVLVDIGRGLITISDSYLELNGAETWDYGSVAQPFDTTLAMFRTTSPPSGWTLSPIGRSSDFIWSSVMSNTITVEGIGGHNTLPQLRASIKKSRLIGWSDTWTDIQKITAFRSWLANRATLNTPVSIQYKSSMSRTLIISPATILSLPDVNTGWSDGGGDTTITGRMTAQAVRDDLQAQITALQALTTSQEA